MEKRILLNQCGYLPHEKKTVTFRGVGELFFLVCKSDGTIVYQGISGPAVYHSSSCEVESLGDFSEVKEEGIYFLSVPGNLASDNEKLKLSPRNQEQPGLGESDFFCIGNDVYREEFLKAVRFFYLQRCGYDFKGCSDKGFGHNACHIMDAKIYTVKKDAGADGEEQDSEAASGTDSKEQNGTTAVSADGKEQSRVAAADGREQCGEAGADSSEQTVEVAGGWHDAGDYGRYTVPGALAAAQLLLAYEEGKKWCSLYSNSEDTAGKTDSSPDSKLDSALDSISDSRSDYIKGFMPDSKKHSMPDYLREIKYELDWLLKMQRSDGAVYHKVTAKSFCSFIMPQDEKEELYLSPVSPAATADFAAVLALAYGIYKEFDEAYANILMEASKKAYDASLKMDLQGGFLNPPGIVTGEYGDECDLDEKYWAAAQLYKAFGDEKYYKDFEALAKEKIYHGYGWADMGSYGNKAILSCNCPVDEELLDKIRESVISQGEDMLDLSLQDGYNAALGAKEYIWGSNFLICNRGRQLLDAYDLTKRAEFKEAAMEQIHYLLGKNPMGICYLTGCGSQSVLRPHHRPSIFLGKAMPGMLAGGPCDWLADDLAKGLLKGKAPSRCYLDMMGSYSTNEVTIYWNSAFIWLLTGCVGRDLS